MTTFGFFDFFKLLEATDRERCLEILAATRLDDGMSEEFLVIADVDIEQKVVACVGGRRVTRAMRDARFVLPLEMDLTDVAPGPLPYLEIIRARLKLLADEGFEFEAAIDPRILKDLCALIQERDTLVRDTQRRMELVSSLKSAESQQYAMLPGRDPALKMGHSIFEYWFERVQRPCAADILINLAYYRRHTGNTIAALEVTECLKGPKFRSDLSGKHRCILATERAAALMDLVEYQRERVYLDEAEKFLKYSQKANKGIQTEENKSAWTRYNRLCGL